MKQLAMRVLIRVMPPVRIAPLKFSPRLILTMHPVQPVFLRLSLMAPIVPRSLPDGIGVRRLLAF
jgi:hypothetical protein